MLPSAVNDTMRDMMAQIRDVGDGIRGGTYTMTAPVITGGSVSGATGSFTSLTDSGNLTFSGTGNRILGDFTNATFANRVAFQTSTTNSGTTLTALPNGTGTLSQLQFYSNSDPTNSSRLTVFNSNAVCGVASDISGTGTYLPLVMNTGGSERLRIDTSGNVGIGTSSPAVRLAGTVLSINGTSQSSFELLNAGASAGEIFSTSSGTFVNEHRALPLIFRTNGGTERMRIDSAGSLLVGATSTSGSHIIQQNTNSAVALTRFISAAATTANQFGNTIELNGDPNNTTQYLLACRGGVGGSADRCVIRSNGGIANYSANNVNLSDVREKTNIELAGDYLDKICSIPVKTFNYIDQNLEEDGDLTLGVIAQDVQAVAPELVMESNWASDDEPEKLRLSIYQTDLQYALMKSIQELKATVDAQAARIAALESK
jgi:hypothetical protein